MSVSWTKEQQSVIDLAGRNILVSAAAGSGKTAVLVERIITMLTRKENPVSVDELLIVTFTEAAAAEMKERIRLAIEKKLEKEPENEYLGQQATLIHSAQITTIHSFCLSVVRDHFHRIDLDPAFRIGEEGELKLLQKDVLQEMLEEKYEEGSREFLDFSESYAKGRDDRKLEDLILGLYEYSRSCPDAEGWLKECGDSYRIRTEEELSASPAFVRAAQETVRCAQSAMDTIDRALEICRKPDGPYMYEDMLLADRENAERLIGAEGYRQMYEACRKAAWKRLAPCRDKTVSEDKAERVKALREEAKALIGLPGEQYFPEDPEETLREIRSCEPMVRVLTGLAGEFAARFEAKKRSLNIIDFSDMEQYALRILTEKEDGQVRPSGTAKEYQEQFREIMIDEYQDSNLIQEAVLRAVSRVSEGNFNIFMVGDVKQSIYRFRLSRPELFMEKFDTYRIYEGEGSDSPCQRIDLHKNFRSRAEVLDSVNYLFRRIMMKELGGIAYDDRAALYPGASYGEPADNGTEILLVNSRVDPQTRAETNEDLSARRAEARAVACRIHELMNDQMVTDKETGELRPVRYSDIVILVRSIKGWSNVFLEVLKEEGIPACSGTKEGYFETMEVGLLLDYLRILNNRKQDIPLAAVLVSHFGKLKEEELAVIRSAFPELPFHQAAERYRSEGESRKIAQKVDACLARMDRFRKKVPHTAIHELLWEILDVTGYGDYVSALPGGAQKKANVEMLVEKAMRFEGTSYKGLFNFIRYIEQLRKYDVDYGEASLQEGQADTVRIMSIHKSKGLEFPVVIVAGMGKRFNRQDAVGSVLVSAFHGLGMDFVDLEAGLKNSTFYKRVIQRSEILENMGEELRVLYVALTRAKEKLILVGTLENPGKKIEALQDQPAGPGGRLSYGKLSSASGYLGWLLPVIAQRGKKPFSVRCVDVEELALQEFQAETERLFTRKALQQWDVETVYDPEMQRHIEEQFGYRYPHPDIEGRKQKFTVSELKKRAYLQENFGEEEEAAWSLGELKFQERTEEVLLPRFRMEQEALSGASRGSAYHRVLELLDFGRGYEREELEESIRAMCRQGKIGEEAAACVNPRDLQAFLATKSGMRMSRAARQGRLRKEQPFVLGVPSSEVYPGEDTEDEWILVQGIIDVWFEEEDGLVVLDYKTDRVKSARELKEKYHTQLEYYAKALEQLLGKKVKEKIIYSFALREEIAWQETAT